MLFYRYYRYAFCQNIVSNLLDIEEDTLTYAKI